MPTLVNVNYLFNDEQSIAVLPNPVMDKIEIRLNGEAEVDVISIYNVTGQIQLNQNDISYDGTVYKANISHLSEGLYFVKTIKGDTVTTESFLKR